ncbi:MAG TPA: P1 family peptidase [Acetobacteraceae bacterium]|nr:P1 family peptidase [Acetobacteraceae bacterium]
MRNLLTDVAGIAVGHATDLALGSGVTAIVFDRPATAAVCVLGGAPGGRDTGLLAPEMTVDAVDAIVLSGGSAFGLDAAGGVQAALREMGRGYAVRDARVPIVPQAIIFDLLNGGNKDWGRFSPYRELGYAAAQDSGVQMGGGDSATAAGFALGSVGGGTGATTAMVKGGLGSASARTEAGHTVGAIAIVNAVGSPLIGGGPWFWAAPYEMDAEFGGLGWPDRIDTTLRLKGGPGIDTTATSTTIGLIATDATLTKAQAHRLAIMAHDGLARAVLPAHAPLDGDTIFAAATGYRPLGEAIPELTALGFAATLVMARAIARGVFAATALPVPGGQPAWRDRFGATQSGNR